MGAFLDVFYPPACAACAKVLPVDVVFCADCELETERISDPRCPICAEPGEHCRRCAREAPVFDRAFAPFVHEGAIAKAIHQFKYEDHPELTRQFGRLLQDEARSFLEQAPRVVSPIPLHRSRRIQRRYDQAALLAVEIAHLTKRTRTLDLLVRTKKTHRQVGLTVEARAENLDGAFSVRGTVPEEVLLIDDVLTTGATARAAAAALKLAGARRVEVLTVARAYSFG